ncbi:MAG: hypothetical protein AAFU65_15100, partial [Pseudomonadota bacterium]
VIPRAAPPLFNLHVYDAMFWDSRVEWGEGQRPVTPAGDALPDAWLDVLEYGLVAAQAMFPVTSRHEMRGELGDNEVGDRCRATYTLGSVVYANGERGEILYIKPSLCASLGADVFAYWRAHPDFPHQSTADQFFDETQFDAYRELGRQIVSEIASHGECATVAAWFDRARVVQATGPEEVPGYPPVVAATSA